MKFVEHYGTDPFELWVGLQAAQKETFGEKAHAGIGTDLAVVACLVADEPAQRHV